MTAGLPNPSEIRADAGDLASGAEAPADGEEHLHLKDVISPAVITFAPLVLALLLWALALPGIDPDRMTDLGLIPVLPTPFFAALALLIIGFCLALARGEAATMAPGAYVVAWVVIIHGTPPIIYGSLRYAWAWKHVGIVDYIQRTGQIDPLIGSMPIYHNWPGFFGAATLLVETAGLDDALILASWTPVIFELLFAGGVLLIMRTASPDWRLAWLGVWVFSLANWVGQDYFAPQAMTYLCYLAVIGIALWAFAQRTAFATSPPGRWLARWRPLASLLAQADRRVAAAWEAGSSLPALKTGQRRGLLLITLLLLAAIAVSHQLTPIVTILALTALVLFGQCRARGLPVIMGLMTAVWLITGASAYAAEGLREIIRTFGQTEENFGNNLIDASAFSPGVRIVSNMARGLTAAVGVLAVAGWLRRVWAGYLDVSLTLLWLVPVGLLAISSYGGEILFRVYYFALPFMAFFVAALFVPRPAARISPRALLLVAATSGLLITSFLFAYFGHERLNYFRPGEIAASEYLVQSAPPGSLLVEVTPNYPSRHRRYDEFVHVPLIPWARGNVEESTNAYSLEEIEEMMADRRYPATYLIVTHGQLLELSNPGLASIAPILRRIGESPAFTVLYENEVATVYGLTSRVGGDP